MRGARGGVCVRVWETSSADADLMRFSRDGPGMTMTLDRAEKT